MVIFIIVLTYSIIGFFEIVPLIKKKQKKELILYLSTFTVAFVISTLIGLEIKLTSPAIPIENAVKVVLRIF